MFKSKKKEKSPYWGSNGVKGLKDEKKPETKRIIFLSIVVCITLLAIIMCVVTLIKGKQKISISSPEIARSMEYDKVESGANAVDGTNNVKFDAFFLRDLDGDGNAEGIRGTCKQVGKEDTLYMELNVLTEGTLKNAKITVDNKNFYLQTALPKDAQFKDNYISDNTKEIEFNDISSGTQKLIAAFVRSGNYTYSWTKTEAIGNDIRKYNEQDNSVTLTGTYVTESGEEIAINKTVKFDVDWYGTVKSNLKASELAQETVYEINDEAETFTVNFHVTTQELAQELILKKLNIKGAIPELNGYSPLEVKILQNTDSFTYDAETKTFTIEKQAETDENGVIKNSIARESIYNLQIVYPLEAFFSIGAEEVTLKVPVETYYEGYNNINKEFENPYKSNTAKSSVVLYLTSGNGGKFTLTVGKYLYQPYKRWVVAKTKPLNIYNGRSEIETDDTYITTWKMCMEKNSKETRVILRENKQDAFIKTDSTEDSLEGIVKYEGIYFANAENILKDNGIIKVYNDETDELIHAFDKTDAYKYSNNNPYEYSSLVKKIRVEVENMVNNTNFYIYHVKELDDEQITTKYTEEEFENIQYITSTLKVQVGEAQAKSLTEKANYEATMSIANISLSKTAISTQDTENNFEIKIKTETNEIYNYNKWINGTFLVKLPEEILEIDVKDVKIDNKSVKITNWEMVKQEGNNYIKINTSNEDETSYEITIVLDITPDPRKATSTKQVELYASNENSSNYYYKGADVFDINNNKNTNEMINKTTVNINIVSPSSLLTSQVASDFDENGNTVVAPQIAEIKPQVATVDQEMKEKTADVGITLKNNYSGTISDIRIVGKIPFKGNTYVLTGNDLDSEFTTKMVNTGIQLPEKVRNVAKVYYTENPNPSKDLEDASNGWKMAKDIESWDNIKTFIIDLSGYTMPKGEEMVFNYSIKIPNGLEYNKVSYSHHGVYFSLDTSEGKYPTSTQSNKIGFKIAEKYNLQLIKFQKDEEKLIANATYKLTEEGKSESKTAITDENGKLIFKGLYVEKTYTIEENNSPIDYELNSEKIKIIGHIENNQLTIEKLEGTTKPDINIEKKANEDYKAILKVEDEVKVRLNLIKVNSTTNEPIKGVKFKIFGDGLPMYGKIMATDSSGQSVLKGLKLNTEYELIELSAKGYYIAEEVKFKIIKTNENYEIQITKGETKTNIITVEENIPIANLTITNEKIPTYNLEIVKIKKTIDTTNSSEDTTYLQGAKFKLFKDNKEIGQYITDENGKIIINGLLEYAEGKDENGTYTLKEIQAPEGYAQMKDMTFKVQTDNGTLKFINTNGNEEKYTVNGNTISLTIANSPSFKLIKKDEETGEKIANVKFAIYNTDNGETPATNSKGEILGTKEIINGKQYYVVSTDANGEITADLKEGFYKAVELQAPDKYDISNSVHYFGVGCSNSKFSGINAEWADKIGGTGYTSINSIIETEDEGFIIGGAFRSASMDLGNNIILENSDKTGNSFDIMLVKYTKNGDAEWGKTIGGSRDEMLPKIVKTSDGGYIVSGRFSSKNIDLENGITLNLNSDDIGWGDGMIIKYDSEWNVEWAKSIGGYQIQNITDVVEDKEENYIVSVYSQGRYNDLGDGVIVETFGNTRTMIIKYGKQGEIKSARAINGVYYLNDVEATSDGGYILVGGFRASSIELENGIVIKNTDETGNSTEGILIKYNSNDEIEWYKTLNGSNEQSFNRVIETTDGEYIVLASFSSDSIELEDGTIINGNDSNQFVNIMMKYDANGNMQWAKKIAVEFDVGPMIKNSDGGYVLFGNCYGNSINLGNGIVLEHNENPGTADGIIAKYNYDGIAEWAKVIGGNENDEISEVTETNDGKYVAIGNFESDSINMENDITLTRDGGTNGMIIKLSPIEQSNVRIEKGKLIGGSGEDTINDITATNDGGYIVVGEFYSDNIDLGNETVLENQGSYTAMIIKYNANDEVEWTKTIKDAGINDVKQTTDGGYIIIGETNQNKLDFGNDVKLDSNYNYNDFVIKYNELGEIEWLKTMGAEKRIGINAITQIDDGGYVVIGAPFATSIDLGNGNIITGKYPNGGLIIKYSELGDIEYANISGERLGLTIIKSTNDGGYIIGGVSYYYNIIIKYSSDNKIEWSKEIGGGMIAGVDGIVQLNDGSYVVVLLDWTSRDIDLGNGVVLKHNGNYYNGKLLIKYNSKGEAQYVENILENDNRGNGLIVTSDGGYAISGKFSKRVKDEANNSIKFEYDNEVRKYNSEGEVEWSKVIDVGTANEFSEISEISEGRYIIGGNLYTDTLELDNGKKLKNNGDTDLVVLEVYKRPETQEIQELVVSNRRKQFKITTEVEEINGAKGGNISGEGKSSYENVKYGDSNTKEIKMIPDENYEIIKITINGVEQEFTVNEDGSYTLQTLKDITEDKKVVVTYAEKNNKITINKIDAKTRQPIAGVKLKIYKLSENGTEYNYYADIETNDKGRVITQLEFGKYRIIETQAQEGYELNETPTEIEFTANGSHEFTIENKKLAKITVHHILKGTNTKLAEDEIYMGKSGKDYTTKPKLDLQGYTLEKDDNGNYNIPENAVGKYQDEEQEITYYYVPQKVKLIVHHYIQGTETPVPLNDGTLAKDIISEGEQGENYTTQQINPDKLGENYSLVEIPSNANGKYAGGEIIVTYYYAQKTGKVITHHYTKGTTTSISRDTEQTLAVGKTYNTNAAKDIPEYYELVEIPKNAAGNVVEGNIEVIYYYQPKKYEYTVEYYFEGEKDDTLTDKFTAEYGSIINTYKDKVKQKYHFDKSENLPLKITDNPETNLIKIYYKKNAYNITTEIKGKGGSISGQGEQPYESVFSKQDSTKDIIVVPDKGYTIKNITVNGEKVEYSTNEDGTANLTKFTTVMEDKNVIAEFRKLFTIVKQGEEETTLLAGAKFKIKDTKGEESEVTTDEEGRINLDLKPGKYTITEIEAPKNYVLPENEKDRTYTIEVGVETKEKRNLKKNWTKENEKIKESGNSHDYNIDGMNIYSYVDTDKGYFVVGSLENKIIIPSENTTDGKEINIDGDGAIIVKINSDEKVEYAKKILSIEKTKELVALGYINKISDGYIGIMEYYDTENKETRNALVKFGNSMEIIEIFDIAETKATDDIEIEQLEDKSYSIINYGTGETSNYQEEVVQEAIPADAPTLVVKNELKEYDYKVEYYYDGELDEEQTEISKAKYGKTVKEYKDKVKDNYVLAKTENLPLTITNEPDKNVIKIYYAKKAEATVQYIDKTTGEVIEESTEDGYVGKEFKTIAKNFKKYILVEEPEQKTVEMAEEKIVLKYYYVQVSSGVIEKHIDINSGELLANETYEGLVGDEYKTKEKNIEGYDLVKEKYPENATGKMEGDVITVTYYYTKQVTVTVQYIDIDTNEKLTEDEIIKGHEGDEYTANKKTIDRYEFVKVTDEESGKMTEDKTIIYYYKKVSEPEPVKPDDSNKTDQSATDKTENNNKEPAKNTDSTIADRQIPNAGLNKLALVLSIITFVMVVFTYISYRRYKILEHKYGNKEK